MSLPRPDRGKFYCGFRRLTQEQLAEQAGIDRRFIQKTEVGELGTSVAVLKRLRKVLKVTWDVLLEGI
jgi:transcriptional regulator with XRE-family HTH domain